MTKYIIIDANQAIIDIVEADSPPVNSIEVLDNSIFDPIRDCAYECVEHNDFTIVDNVITLKPEVEIQKLEEIRINAIKNEANIRIIGLLPDGEPSNFLMKENNIQARVSYLMRKEIKGTITAEESTELDNAELLWKKIEDIRKMSDAAELNGDSLITLQAAYDAKEY